MTPTPVVFQAQQGGDNTIAMLGLVLGLLGLVANAILIWYTISRNKQVDLREIRREIDELHTAIVDLRARNLDRQDIYTRLEDVVEKVTRLETKMGLFWGGVEEMIPKMLAGKFNPIHLEPDEQIAYDEWEKYKSRTHTGQLRILEDALDRELHEANDIPFEEAMAAFFILQAVKAQLVDRGEPVVKSRYE